MSSLITALNISTGAMQAEQGAMEATANNVANVNTEGYSREIPAFAENPPFVLNSLTFGTGVSLEKLSGVRDSILQLRIQSETGEQGKLDAMASSLNQVQTLFAGGSNDIGSLISNLFASISQLSTNSASIPLRQSVLTAASNLASAFRSTANNLTTQRSNLDQSVVNAVEQVNALTQQISGLNGQIATLENAGQDASAFVDKRDVLVNQLSGLIDVSRIQTESGITLTTSNGTALVAGNQSFLLNTQLDLSGVQHIFAQGTDITTQLNSGQLGGLLAVRDQSIPELLSGLDTLASSLGNAFNSANAAGFDLNGNNGGNIFSVQSGAGAAAGISVAISDPALIAASSDGSAGSNGNLATFSAIHDQATIAGQTPSDYYGNLVFGIGNDVSTATAELQSSQLVLQQLQDQRGSISGVSLDEEAAHMVQYQRAFESAARVASTVNQMLETVINMVPA
jgi:flagellar hook-associated protein 1